MELTRIQEQSVALQTRLSDLKKTVDLTPAEVKEMEVLQVCSEEKEREEERERESKGEERKRDDREKKEEMN